MAWNDYLYDWVDVGDSKVCPTCRRRGNEPPRLFGEWEAAPGDGQSECDGYCRCIFLPHAVVEFDTSFEGGKTILMDLTNRRANFPISLTFEEQVFKQVDELVGEYEAITQNWNLPEMFYEIQGPDNKRDFMRKLNVWIRSGKIPAAVERSILLKNPWMKGKFPVLSISYDVEAVKKRLESVGIKNVFIDKLKDKESLRLIEEQLTALTKNYRPLTVVRASNIKGDVFAKHQLGGPDLNLKWFNDAERLKKEILKSIKDKFHVSRIKEAEAIKSIITHEFAHDLTRQEILKKTAFFDELKKIRRRYKVKLKQMRADFEKKIPTFKTKKQFDQALSDWKKERDGYYISQYASKSYDEFLAEAFTDYIHGEKPSPFSIEVGNLVDRYFRGKQ